jgi:hypothetical protein
MNSSKWSPSATLVFFMRFSDCMDCPQIYQILVILALSLRRGIAADSELAVGAAPPLRCVDFVIAILGLRPRIAPTGQGHVGYVGATCDRQEAGRDGAFGLAPIVILGWRLGLPLQPIPDAVR